MNPKGSISNLAQFEFTDSGIHNNVSYNNSSGLYTEFMNNSDIYNNILYNNSNNIYTNEVYGIGVASCNNSNLYNNVIHDNGNKGIDLYGDTTTSYGPSNGNKFYNNLIYNQTEGTGFTIGGTNGGLNDNIISYNILFNNKDNFDAGGTGGQPYNSNNIVVNNVIYGALNCGLNLAYYNNPGIIVENNIFSNNNSTSGDIFAWSVTANFTTTNNIYYHPDGGVSVYYNGVYYEAENMTSFNLDAITSNPLFTNGSGSYSEASDFMLEARLACNQSGEDRGAYD